MRRVGEGGGFVMASSIAATTFSKIFAVATISEATFCEMLNLGGRRLVIQRRPAYPFP
jgi:hypothetical protein